MSKITELIRAVRLHSLSSKESLEATYDIARACIDRGILGDFVECGVFQGGQCAIMARAIMDEYGEDRRVHLFDSFQGMPAAEPRDQEIWAHHGAKTGESRSTMLTVAANMERWGIPRELLVYHPGWFHSTIPTWRGQNPEASISLLRLDCDLFASTKVAIDELYPLVSHGGWVIADDWNLSGFREAIQIRVVPAPIYWRKPTK
jgi:O-methyltransferase